MALGGITKSSKKKSPTTADLKKENAALKKEVDSLKADLEKAVAAAAIVEVVEVPVEVKSDADKELEKVKTAVKSMARHHPVIRKNIVAAGLSYLLA